MYRWLLCFRYLRTRYIALASVISVTLGVATLIVVNSVMAGFAVEMHDRLHGLASDVVIECHASGGLPDPDAHVDEIRRIVGKDLAGTSVSVHVPSMLGIEANGQTLTRHVNLVGIDAETYDDVSHFGRYLLHPENRNRIDFQLKKTGYPADRGLADTGWKHRKLKAQADKRIQANLEYERQAVAELTSQMPVASDGPTMGPMIPSELMQESGSKILGLDPEEDQYPGIVLGISTCSMKGRDENGEVVDHYYCRPGDDVQMMFPNASDTPKVIDQRFTVVDFYESKMSEYDSTFAFVRLDELQKFRGMINEESGVTSVTTIQLKLTEGADLNGVRDALQARFPPSIYAYNIQTWKDMQGPLLSAVALETTILNILLFLIIAVAGFGILATFFMIVVEKTRDIGTLKALGASSGGVMSIFLTYGLLLGIVGSGVGLVGGVVFVHYINDVARVIERITGQEVFDPTVYYFTEIPTIINPVTLIWVMFGAVTIAIIASVLPALRAARMHPVAALRFE